MFYSRLARHTPSRLAEHARITNPSCLAEHARVRLPLLGLALVPKCGQLLQCLLHTAIHVWAKLRSSVQVPLSVLGMTTTVNKKLPSTSRVKAP